jgi:hypothetical protein
MQRTPWTRDDTDPARRLTFFTGSHRPHWLTFAQVPLFISARTLADYRTTGDDWPTRAAGRFGCGIWALDSGGFSELSMFGEWQTDEGKYVGEVRRWRDEIGLLDWAAAQDWMCEPFILAKTGKTIEQHQRLTVENYLTLRMLAPDLPFVPVLQGWTVPDDYLRHVDQYAQAGVDLFAIPRVGLGSVCRRQH